MVPVIGQTVKAALPMNFAPVTHRSDSENRLFQKVQATAPDSKNNL